MSGVERVRAALTAAFSDGVVEVSDLTGGGDHVRARVISEAFAGKSPVERHRMVYAALGRAFEGPVHALSLQTQTPAEASAAGPRAPREKG